MQSSTQRPDSHRAQTEETVISLATLRRDQIRVEPDFNHRSEVGDQPLGELAQSIKENGILQPPRVKPAEDNPGCYVLVAGHRRLMALDIVALEKPEVLDAIDVVVEETATSDSQSLVQAIVENVQRVDINPVDEARAYTRLREHGLTLKGIAQQVGVAQKRVTERLELLKFPDEVVRLLQSGELPVSARNALKKLQDVSSGLCVACANAAVTAKPAHRDAAIRTLCTKPADVVRWLADQPEAPFWHATGEWHPEHIRALRSDGAKQIANEVAKLECHENFRWVSLSQERVGELLATGAAYQIDKRQDGSPIAVVVDQAALEGALRRALGDKAKVIQVMQEQAAERARKEAAEAPAENESDETKAARQTAIAKAEQALERARERERELAALAEVRGRNLDLGRALVTEGASMGLSRDVAEVLCLSVLTGLDTAANFQSGLRLCLENFQLEDVKTRKVTYAGAKKGDARRTAWQWVNGAESAEGMVGRTVSLLIAAVYADLTAQPESQRVAPKVPAEALAALARIAEGVVPEGTRKRFSEDQKAFTGDFGWRVGWEGTYDSGGTSLGKWREPADSNAPEAPEQPAPPENGAAA